MPVYTTQDSGWKAKSLRAIVAKVCKTFSHLTGPGIETMRPLSETAMLSAKPGLPSF